MALKTLYVDNFDLALFHSLKMVASQFLFLPILSFIIEIGLFNCIYVPGTIDNSLLHTRHYIKHSPIVQDESN